MKFFQISFFLCFVILLGCKDERKTDADLEQLVVDEAIKVIGGEKFKHSVIEFDFRDRLYKATRDRWKFQYERFTQDSLGIIRDVLSNSGFQRFINDSLVVVADTMVVKYTSSVNAVHYFSILPFGLNDKAVNKTYLGETVIKDKTYHKVKITFNEEGGGEDFEDVFVYWINTANFRVDYLAYSYIEDNNDIGLRFREAYNRREVNGLVFVDYNNYKPKASITSEFELDKLLSLDRKFQVDSLQLLSKIELENIQVSLLPKVDQ
ncbi:hypothetical protein OE09_1834 [Flavobacteriaceae bacterium MAR_2010_72]|nr:hypothetical protein OE09_1834 [Flavobacteriaceae bacterium MAR_2010_72]TVZ59451.1 hypothetical protein NA63_1985 [Flavobacteriaceae bacterium MAR_2010_105]